MPITRTQAGLIYFDELDEQDGWEFKNAYPLWHIGIDTATKKSGTGSLHVYQSGDEPYAMKSLELGSGAGRVARFWHKIANPGAYGVDGIRIWVSPGTDESYRCMSAHDWQLHTLNLTSSSSGPKVTWLADCRGPVGEDWVDRLVIAKSTSVTISSLSQGQKVGLYRASDNTLIAEATCQAGQTSVTISVMNEDFPEQMYLKIYGVDGTTLIETTGSYEMCGGDVWNWVAGTGPLTAKPNVFIIYRTGSGGSPTSAAVTAKLTDGSGNPLVSKTIYFSSSIGNMNPTSANTNANGEAQSTLTSSTHGRAVVEVKFLGDASYPAAAGYCMVHVFYAPESGDANKEYQFFIEGIEYKFVAGHYTLSEEGHAEEFEVEIPEWDSTITAEGLVSIYRRGVKEFAGVLRVPIRTLSESPRVILRGPDVSCLLDRVIELENYSAKTSQFIIEDLLNKYFCGIIKGNLGNCLTALTIVIDTEELRGGIMRVVDAVGWKYRVKSDLTLDFAQSFSGGHTTAQFREGFEIIEAEHSLDYDSVANWVRMRGNGITTTKHDGTRIKEQGLHQMPVFQKSISDLATLEAACQAYLDQYKNRLETIPAEVVDDYPVGTFGPEDEVTVTAQSIDLAGWYVVKRITRDMKSRIATLELSNRRKQLWDIDETYRRMTKDVNV